MVYDELVVGAGLFGAVYARQRALAGRKILVIDKRPHVAGNIYTEKKMGIDVHRYGAHIFHTSDKEVWDYVNRFSSFNGYINSPLAVYKDELYNLPFNMNTFSRLWNIRTPEEASDIIKRQSVEEVRRILKERADRGDSDAARKLSLYKEGDPAILTDFVPENLEEQGLFLAGRDVFDKLVRGYTEKQWGKSCRELPSFIIKRLPFRFIYDNNYFNDRYQGIPEDGYTELTERILGMDGRYPVENGEIKVMTGTDFKDLAEYDGETVKRDEGAFVLKNGDRVHKIMYTGPIDEFCGYCFGALEYRSLRFETEELPDTDNYQGNAVINYTESEVPYTRVIEHKHFIFGKGKGTIVTREYPMNWKAGDEPYYPMNDDKNNKLYDRYREYAEGLYPEREKVLTFGGRLGLYRYYNMDQAVREALNISSSC